MSEYTDVKTVIKNAQLMIPSNRLRVRGSLQFFIRDLCGVGSQTARLICIEHDWDPDQSATIRLE